MATENKHFFRIILAGIVIISVVSQQVFEQFRDRLKENNTFIKTVTGKISKVVRVLQFSLDIDGVVDILPVKVIDNLDQDIVLRMDF